MHRRSFLIGTLAVGISSTLPFKAVALANKIPFNFEDDLASIIKTVLAKYETGVERLTDLMDIFEDEVTTYMTGSWHTYQPPREIQMISKQPDGTQESRPSGWLTNPNFSEQLNCAGGWRDQTGFFHDFTGFRTSFLHPDDKQTVNVRFSWHDRKVYITYEPRRPEQPSPSNIMPKIQLHYTAL
jgi:hypothetical protein